MKIEMTFVELHNPLFLGGVNWGNKLQPKTGKGILELVYDRSNQELLITFGKFQCIVPSSNIASMTLKGFEMPIAPQKSHSEIGGIERAQVSSPTTTIQNEPEIKRPGRPVKAINSQAATPHDHVFKGVGAGKVND